MKAVIFDFDGTLTKSKKGSSCWYNIWVEIDDLEYDDKLYSMYKRNEIDDFKWSELIYQRYVEKDVNPRIMQAVADKVELQNGAYETLKALHSKGIKIFILSGGVRQVIEKILEREDLNQFITSLETYDLIFDKSGKLVDFKRPRHNPEFKNQYIDIVKQQYKINAKDILFVGNGKNDQEAYKSGAVTLCINPDDAEIDNRIYWSYGIRECNDLQQILKYC